MQGGRPCGGPSNSGNATGDVPRSILGNRADNPEQIAGSTVDAAGAAAPGAAAGGVTSGGRSRPTVRRAICLHQASQAAMQRAIPTTEPRLLSGHAIKRASENEERIQFLLRWKNPLIHLITQL